MKNLALILLTGATFALAALCIAQGRHDAGRLKQIRELETIAEQRRRQISELQALQDRAEQQSLQLARLSDEMAAEFKARETALEAAATNHQPAQAEADHLDRPAKEPGGLGKVLANMIQDPEMKKFIRQQQRGMMNPLYGPLIQRLGLTADEADKFKEMLADGMMRGAEMASAMFGNAGTTNRAEITRAMAAEQKAQEEQLRAFLGETRFEQYRDYQQTVGERAQLNQFRQQATGDGQPITDEETELLLQLMKEEKKTVADAMGLSFPDQGPAQMEAMLEEGHMDRILQAQENVNQRVYERAAGFLGPEQLQNFGQFQTNQVQMLRMGLAMARKMMAPQTAGSPGSGN